VGVGVSFSAPRNTLKGTYLASSVKLRQAGFLDCIDTEDMFLEWIRHLQRTKVLPPPRGEVGGAAAKL